MLRKLLSWLGLGSRENGSRKAVLQKLAGFPALSEWVLDPYHTQIRFRVMHMGLVEVVGRFTRFTAEVRGSSPAFSDLAAAVEIEVDSLQTDMSARDLHLKSPDFLDAEKHPRISFRSVAVRWRPLKRFLLEGDLTIKGITHRIQLDGELKGLVFKDLVGHPRVSFHLTAQIDRQAWGLTWQMETQDGTPVADNLVTLDIDAEITTPAAMEALRQMLAQMGMPA